MKFNVSLPEAELVYTPEQLAVANCGSSHIIVRSLAGTGKTETVALRVKTQIDAGTDPAKILVATFTKSARDQITKRLRTFGISGVRIATLHSVAFQLLRDNNVMFPVTDGRFLMRRALKLKRIDAFEENVNMAFSAMTLSRTAGGFILPKNCGFPPSQLRDAIRLYHTLKEENDEIDFADLFLFADRFVAPIYDEVIIDEAQDLTPDFLRFAECLTSNSFILVGDQNQSIYAFNGGDGAALDSLDITTLPLSQSFRSAPEIIQFVAPLIPDAYTTALKNPGRVTPIQNISDQNAAVIASVASGTQVVLARTKFELKQIATALETAGYSVDKTWLMEKERPERANVILKTIHSAKGGEWSNVCITGLGAEGFRSVADTEIEAKKLLYVAITRAKTALDLIYYDALPFGLGGETNDDRCALSAA